MKFSHFFIDRPIFASVISIILVLAGTVAMLNLPIAQFPDITPPQISVSATYPGANAEVVAQNVAAPIEQQVNGADNMMYMNSSRVRPATMTLTVFFEIGTDPVAGPGGRAEPRQPRAAAAAARRCSAQGV